MKLAVALLLAPAAAYVPLRATTQRQSTMVRAEEPEKMDLDLGEMFELFDESVAHANSDPDRNVLSYLTPMGQALLNHKPGEEVAMEGDDRRFRIESIQPSAS